LPEALVKVGFCFWTTAEEVCCRFANRTRKITPAKMISLLFSTHWLTLLMYLE